MIEYRESADKTEETRKKYVDGLNEVISARQEKLATERREYFKDIFTNLEKYREDLKNMLGWPLTEHTPEGIPTAKSTELAREKGYTIYRMSFQILDGLEMTGLYFKMDGDEKKPLVLVQHGGLGTPEIISGLYGGDTANYNDMLARVIAHGVHAFAPQLLLWDKEKYGVEFDRHNMDARLKRVGGSITAVELYGLARILDYFEVNGNISNFGMVGLSYGGFYTLLFSALDTRIRSAVSCGFFNTRDKYPWNDWTWFGSAAKFDDAELAAMVYPRSLCIEIGKDDPIFDVKYGERSYERLLEICKAVGTEWLSFIPFDGAHEFCTDDAPIEALVRRIKG